MSESALEHRPLSFPAVRPEAFIGAASPLWAYFTGAAMMGVAWWWATRWAQAADQVAAPIVARLPLASALAADDLPPLAVGGEAAPVSPLAETPMAVEAQAPGTSASQPVELAGSAPIDAPAGPSGGTGMSDEDADMAELEAQADLASEAAPPAARTAPEEPQAPAP